MARFARYSMDNLFRVAAVIAVAMLPGLPAAAQDLAFDAGQTEACLATAPDRGKCVGLAAETCIEATPGGYSTVAMGGCYAAEAVWWDDRLNATYAGLIGRHRAEDAEDAEYRLPATGREAALRAMQRAWIPFRDAACDWERAQWGGGTGQGPAGAECHLRLTAEQALRLADKLGELR